MLWVYILQNPAGNFYIGHTDNLENRIRSHNRTDTIAGKFTRENGPWALVWSEEHPNRSSAMRRELEIKELEICTFDPTSPGQQEGVVQFALMLL